MVGDCPHSRRLAIMCRALNWSSIHGFISIGSTNQATAAMTRSLMILRIACENPYMWKDFATLKPECSPLALRR